MFLNYINIYHHIISLELQIKKVTFVLWELAFFFISAVGDARLCRALLALYYLRECY